MPTTMPEVQYPRSIIPHVGTEVTGDRRFPRPELEAEFDSMMTGSNGATLFGLRRIGKSSEAGACAERLAAAQRTVIKLNAEGMTSESQLLFDVLKALPAKGWRERAMKAIGDDNAISGVARDAISKMTGTAAEDIQSYFRPIAAAIERSINEVEQTVLFIDEFPWLCRSVLQADSAHGGSRIDVLMASLRRWRDAGMRMMLMGSIGLISLAREYKLDLSHLNDLAPLTVPPLEREEALALVRALAVGGDVSGWTEAHTQALLDQSAALYASMLQRAFLQLSVGKRAAPLDKIADLFAEKIRPDLDASFYRQFDRRIAVYTALDAPTPALLDTLLVSVLSMPDPVSMNTLVTACGSDISAADLGDALGILREDGFLHMRVALSGEQHWRCASDLVKAWWRIRRGGRAT